MRARLPHIEFQLTPGMHTKANPRELAAAGLLKSDNADGYEEFGSWGQVPGSTLKCDPAGGTWKWLEYFEYYNLGGVLTREKIGLAGTRVVKINSDKTLTELAKNFISEEMTSVTTLDKNYFSSPSNDPKKYDGGDVSRWGVWAPGTEEEVFEAFDDHTDFSVAGGSKSDSTVSKDAGGSVQVDCDDNTTLTTTLTRAAVTLDLSQAGNGIGLIWLQVPVGALNDLRKTDYCVRIGLDDGSNIDYHTYLHGELTEGWNLLVLSLLAPDVDNGADLSAITDLTFDFLKRAVSVTPTGFLWDKLYVLDNGSATAVNAGAGSVTGSVTYRVTYVSKHGVESNAGVPSVAFSAGATGVTVGVSGIPVSPDPQIGSRRLYRDLDGDSQWRFVVEIFDNDTHYYADTVSFAATAATTPPLAADAFLDHSPPPRMQQVVEWKGHLIWIDAGVRFQIGFSNLNAPEEAPLNKIRQFDDEVTALIPHALGLLIEHTDGSTILEGENYANFRFTTLSPKGSIGCAGFRAFAPFKRFATTWHDDGPYANDAIDPWFMGGPILDQIKALDASTFRDLFVINDRSRFRHVFFVDGEIFVYSYGMAGGRIDPTGAGIDPLDFRLGSWSKLVLPAAVNPKCAVMMEDSGDSPELWIGCDDGFVYRLQDPAAIDYADGHAAAAIATDIRTGWQPLGEDVVGYPRFLSIEARCTAPSVWTAVVETARSAEGTVIGSKTITVNLATGLNSLELPVPSGAWGEYARVRMSNSRLGEDGFFRKINLHMVPRKVRRSAA